ncbi:MAG: hypothetical protein HDS65_01390 [Bacteroidales bacterium]|nr:hypothetical protein [Bacteroidales bacterium]
MATKNNDILAKAQELGLKRPSAGLEVPEGYFENFATRMAEMLPERPEIESSTRAEVAEVRSFWQKVRPYVYMAAMFAGIWLMMQLFTNLSGAGQLTPLSDNPVLANALSDDSFVLDYIYDDVNSWDIVDEMLDDETFDDETYFESFLTEPESDADYILPQ